MKQIELSESALVASIPGLLKKPVRRQGAYEVISERPRKLTGRKNKNIPKGPESFEFQVYRMPDKGIQRSLRVTGVIDFGLEYTSSELKNAINFFSPNPEDGKQYWLGSSALIPPKIVFGHHAYLGKVMIYPNSFCANCSHGLRDMEKTRAMYETFQTIEDEVNTARNLHHQKMLNLVNLPCVLVSPEAIAELQKGKQILTDVRRRKRRSKEFDYARYIFRDLAKRDELLHDIEESQEEMPQALSPEELTLTEFLNKSAVEDENSIAPQNIRFVSRVILNAHRTKQPQVILTSSGRIERLLTRMRLSDIATTCITDDSPFHLRTIEIQQD